MEIAQDESRGLLPDFCCNPACHAVTDGTADAQPGCHIESQPTLMVGSAVIVGHRRQHVQQQCRIVVVTLGQARHDTLWNEVARVITGIWVVRKDYPVIVGYRILEAVERNALVAANQHHSS